MKKFYEDRRTMFYVVEKFVKETDPAVLALMPSFAGAFSEFEAIIEKISLAQAQRVDKITGSRIEKEEKRLIMCQLTEVMASRLRSLAIDTGDDVLYEKTRLPLSRLMKIQDTVSADFCLSIIEMAQEHLAALAPYGVVAADITAMEDARNEFLLWQPEPRYAISTRKIFTREVYALIRKGMKLLDNIDVYFSTLKYSHPKVFENYLSKRMIVDTGGRKLSLRGVIYSDEGMEVGDVTVRIASLGVQTKSTQKGNFEFKKLAAGIHVAEFSKYGYEPTTVQFAVVDNQRTDLKVEMKKVVFGAIAS